VDVGALMLEGLGDAADVAASVIDEGDHWTERDQREALRKRFCMRRLCRGTGLDFYTIGWERGSVEGERENRTTPTVSRQRGVQGVACGIRTGFCDELGCLAQKFVQEGAGEPRERAGKTGTLE
jgi:hypothetical protein